MRQVDISRFFTPYFSDRRVKSNDELLYDPGADDADEKWMEERGKSIQKARNSDAVLNCPRFALFSLGLALGPLKLLSTESLGRPISV